MTELKPCARCKGSGLDDPGGFGDVDACEECGGSGRSLLASQAKQAGAVQLPDEQRLQLHEAVDALNMAAELHDAMGGNSNAENCRARAYELRQLAALPPLPAPIEQITPGNTDGVRVDAPTKCKDCGAKITDGAAKCPRGGGRTCWVGQQPTVGVAVVDGQTFSHTDADAAQQEGEKK